jgi:hypothetical protein
MHFLLEVSVRGDAIKKAEVFCRQIEPQSTTWLNLSLPLLRRRCSLAATGRATVDPRVHFFKDVEFTFTFAIRDHGIHHGLGRDVEHGKRTSQRRSNQALTL